MTENNNIIIYTSEDGIASVALFERDGNVWLNQIQLAELFDTFKQNISLNVNNVLQERELDENSVVNEYLTTALYSQRFEGRNTLIEQWLKDKDAIWFLGAIK